ncbi:tyrosine-type recombinase/integrase [Pseudoclavibacter sp. RFBG4]|uniref:tyrosine-type recombinase/integrase n=1 Tax=Pseudoclavibacter sp. RFBG4 TaxID=2080575 RepID=UPI0011B0BFC7|nr:tyrosine-type recombinase/integrase [Pseudoclavibacter sp. RFBG4]
MTYKAKDKAMRAWYPVTMSLLNEFAIYERSQDLAETTIKNRESILMTLQQQAGAPLDELTVRDLRLFMGREGVSPNTRVTTRTVLRAFYSWLVLDGLRDDDPSLRLPTVRAVKGEPRPFTTAQIEQLLFSGSYTRTRIMILLGYRQGFRASSIARVHGQDIDRESELIRTIGKGGKDRHLPLDPLIAEVSLYMPQDDWWFKARGGRQGHILSASVTNLITLAKKRAGITDPTLTPHSLRHSYGTELAEAGIDSRVIQELMMHESLQTTQIYTGISLRRKQEAKHLLPLVRVPERSGRAQATVAA